ncbi:MAG: sugar ABC transporter permease [Lachnospiraceae bacterium]|nr:sugar ABC transporter permease [Lachnospiraceae bacterium]
MNVSKKTPYLFLAPYLLMFIIFIALPVIVAILLSFTDFDTINMPNIVWFRNYVLLITSDSIFMQYVLPNTITYALIVGPGGYALSFLLAWAIAQLTRIPRTILALVFYSPSLTMGTAMQVLWKIVFSGDRMGIINSYLIQWGFITEPIVFLSSANWLLPVMIIVGLWSAAGVGFLAMLAGIMNADEELYEAGAIDGVSNRFQELIYITIPTMKPQMLFGAVMAIVNTFNNGMIGVQLSGSNPTPGYAGQLIVNHIDDYGFIRFEMGYAAAVSVALLLLITVFSKVATALFTEKD